MVFQTLEEIKNYPEDMLTAENISKITKRKADSIRAQAYKDPKMLGFNVMVTGKEVGIPRPAFIRWMEGAPL